MEMNERQAQCLSTCMESCRNIAYPELGGWEEKGEFLQKLLPLVTWNPDFKDRTRLEELLKGLVYVTGCIGKYAKQMRHDGIIPFELKKPEEVDEKKWSEWIKGLLLEGGDENWMWNVKMFYVCYGTGAFEQDQDFMNAMIVAMMNWQKLQKRKKEGTIDGKGDNERSSISEQ